LTTLFSLGGCGTPLDEQHQGATASKKHEEPLINGADNRLEGGAHPDWSLLYLAARSTAAVMPADRVNVPSPYPPPPRPPWEPVTFNAPTLKQAYNLCDGQRFANELTPATCTATLIDDDLVITDGHCVSAANCENMRFVFDYFRYAENEAELNTLYKVFKCQSVVVSQTAPADYAIVRLDRPASRDQVAAAVRRSRAPLAQGLPLAAIGHTDGTSVKVASGGAVLSQGMNPANTFQLSLDGSAVGSVGAGIYYQDSAELAAIWTDPSHGEADYVPGPTGSTPYGCLIAKPCPESGCGTSKSVATYVGVALDAYCAANANPRLCEPRNTLTFSAGGNPYSLRGSVYLEPGATIDYGTCMLPGSSAVSDTTVDLYGPYFNEYGYNDDGGGSCGFASHATYTTPPLTGGRYTFRPGCYLDTACSGTIAYTVSGPTGGSYSYSAANTNSGSQGTQDFTVSLRQGETLIAGTCGLENANFSGDTFLALKLGGATVTYNDDACGGLGSQLTYTAPSAQTLTLAASCYGSAGCSGTVAFSKGVSNIPFSAANTYDGTQNTVDRTLRLVVGDKVTIGTCGLPGASYSGDTVASLFLGTTRVSFNDNDCTGLGSRLGYRVTTAGDYTVRIGCSQNSACSGNAVVRVTPPSASTSSLFYNVSGTASATTASSTLLLSLRAGDVLTTGTCPTMVGAASGTGDTYMRLFGPDGLQNTFSDDDCPNNDNSLLSSITDVTITPDKAGPYLLRSGCYGNTACSATLVYTTP